MTNTPRTLALAFALALPLAGCRAEVHEELGIETGRSTVDPEPFLAVLPFRTDIEQALADIAAGHKPGMLFYADPT